MIQTLQDALSARGYDTLTPVQEAVTAPELDGADLLVSAQTGSGKTVGFGLAIGPTLLDDDGKMPPANTPVALIVAPTRELAMQVQRELAWLYADTGARFAACVGGMDMRDQRRALERGAHIVVGTPGRLTDHIRRGSLKLDGLKAAVLDEADEMLDLGFREDLEFMLAEAPSTKRTLMFSATVPAMIATLAKKYQNDAVRVNTVGGGRQHSDIQYQAMRVHPSDAENAIINVLRFHDAENAIVFANTRATVARLTARLGNRGLAVVSLSGELSQTERTHALQAMRDGRAKVCVATDVAARGIDLPNLDLVIHAELPTNTEGLLHRSGRTGRAGRKGVSALVVPPKATSKAERLLKWAKINAEWVAAPSADDILKRDEERLLSDESWADEITPEEAAFAEKLMAQYDAETIAAGYLRLYRAHHSAPEELSDPTTAPKREERKPFGPSAWVALSKGRNDRAEPRWILPLICRMGGLTKDQIGAIRIQPAETYVELTADSIDGFMAATGGKLEDGMTVRRADGPPDSGPRPAKRSDGPSDGPRAPKPGAPKAEAKSDWSPEKTEPAPSADMAPRKPRAPKADAGPKKRWDKSADGDAPKKRWDKPADGAAPKRDKPTGAKPAHARADRDASAPKKRWDKPKGGKPGDGAKPHRGKPGPGATSDRSSAGPSKPGSKVRPGAANTGQRMERPGGKPKGKGGDKGPRRK
ncbi:DEAD-box ATP-dependent RNA helicase CshA [Rhodobacteraceae bacterium THAF1]|uniref:DEAD/DEAH box helicase n=1 Tax=Palleronia sp. THAF1 TaxID=2587842 RepID=UPI000F415E82|nr:DEAD/DEAH box helicase [Palleronia sp. THAF1]QFU08338.1 DEAD-box ATP-dependent RNA helicase CshA [Palleronia sp. THAF1]VDC28997.1 DEAD-box ATP-dependent RNA helicase CshA [Rhodobacteraceae bacterium THAF1]